MLTMRLSRLGLLISFPLLAAISPSDWTAAKLANEPEALFVRRIADFWEEGEYQIAKSQMEEFLASFPDSQFADPIRCCLGDLFLREKNFSDALAVYSALASQEFTAKVFLNRMQCLYNLGWYSTLVDECEESLTRPLDDDERLKSRFYLAIALYHQCLNEAKNPEALLKLAKKAEPHFSSLLESELSVEIAQAYAHLSCILKEYEKAAGIYLELAAKDPLIEDEMHFQAALIQTEYDPNLALESFDRIAKNGQKKASEAAYNHLILSFDTKHFEEIVNGKDAILASIPEERKGMARYYFGQSLLALKQYNEAANELTAFLEEENSSLESVRSCLVSLIEAAHQSSDVASLDKALAKLAEIDPSNGQIAKGRFLKSILLKNSGKIEEAREELTALLESFCNFSDRAAVLFEWTDLEYQAGCWDACRSRSLAFLEEFPKSELAPFAWRYLATASNILVNDHPDAMEQFAKDLEALMQHKDLFPDSEARDWGFYLARSYYNLGRFAEAAISLESILKEAVPFSQQANAHLLLSLCYRDGKGETALFCEHAETALSLYTNSLKNREFGKEAPQNFYLEPAIAQDQDASKDKNSELKPTWSKTDSSDYLCIKADMMEPGHLHVSLFNAYLELSKENPNLIEKSAEHLYEAFISGVDISRENLLWLGDWYFAKKDHLRSSKVFSSLLESGFDETACYKLGKLHSNMCQTDAQISLMEKAMEAYLAAPSNDWLWERETKLLLGEALALKGQEERALKLFDEVTNGNPAIQSETIAQAYLGKAKIQAFRLKQNQSDNQTKYAIASQFKDLILQRKLDFEPIHLEAALEYVGLMYPNHLKVGEYGQEDSQNLHFEQALLAEKQAAKENEDFEANPKPNFSSCLSIKSRIEKRLALLEKIKKDFESKEDILSMDYHQARLKYPDKNRIFENYMRFLDVEILMAKSDLSTDIDVQKELQAKTKDLLLQIRSECDHPALLKRVASRLQNSDVSVLE